MSTSLEMLDSLKKHQVLDDQQLARAATMLESGTLAPDALIAALEKNGWLTSFQSERVRTGRVAELLLNNTYLLVDVLGEGGMGQVYRAMHLVLKSARAVKLIRPEITASSYATQRFYREMEMVARLNHPNIVQAYDAGSANGVHYLVMELVEGRDLAAVLRGQGPLPSHVAADFVRQAAVGLHHAFEQGLIHRDVKPSNLLLMSDGSTIKILDLGLARLREAEPTDQLTPTGLVMGTPDYMAPEQTIDAKSVDIRADVYALGCTLYHLLTGDVPFPGGDVINKLIRHRQKRPAPVTKRRSDVPAGLLDVLNKLMAKHPKNRHQTPKEVADDLSPFCTEPAGGSGPATEPLRPIPIRSPSGETARSISKTLPEEDLSKSNRRGSSATRPPSRRASEPELVQPLRERVPLVTPLPERPARPREQVASGGAFWLTVALIGTLALGGVGFGLWYWLSGDSTGDDSDGNGVSTLRESALRVEATNDLKRIGLAMHSYHDNWHKLPDAVVRDQQGKPLYGWRVELLPYVEQTNLYKAFRREEPWDSPHNKQFIARMPKVYEHPFAKTSQPGMTHYQLFTGPRTVFSGMGPTHLARIQDGTSNTVLVVEAAKPVPWTAPEDIVFSDNVNPLTQVGGHFQGVFLVCMGDGSTLVIDHKISEKTMRIAITPDDGLPLGEEWLRHR